MSGNNNVNYQAMLGQNSGYQQQQPFNPNAFPQLGGAPQGQQQPQYNPYQGQNYPQQFYGQPPQQYQPTQASPIVPQQQQPAGIGGFAGFAAFSFDTPAASTAAPASTSSSFNLSSVPSFVPKSKQGNFPELGAQTAAPTETKKKDEDPCHGKAKEFFIYSYDERSNVCTCTFEQLTFVSIHYPEHYTSPIDILMWLYDMAEFRDQQKAAKPVKIAKAIEGGAKQKKPQYEEYEEIDDEETSFGPKSYKDIKKKKPTPAPAPKAPGGSKQMTEAQREDERKNKLKQMEENKKKEEAKKMLKDVGRDKDLQTLETENEMVEVDETRNPCSLVFIGHVDAGKSTISGNLMYAMGVVDKRTIDKYKEEAKSKNRESWWLAYVMDENEEEKAKGKTVEIGRANFDTPHKRWTIFDAPGHKNYVPNMIMGAALADYGALVISAKKGEFEAGFEAEGQTREHVQLAKSLGIFKLIVVINKMDEPTVKWQKERYNDIVNALKPFLALSGYDPENDCIFIPVSGLCGENIDKPLEKSVCSWYQDGRTLLQVLDDLPLPKRDAQGPLRIPLLDKMQDRGAVIFGKVESGTIRLGDKLKLMPSGISCQVHTIYNSKDQCVRYAKPGENVKLRLNIESEDRVNKGDVICHRDQSIVPVAEIFEAEVQLYDLIPYKPIISKGYQCMLHIHTVADEATITELLASYDRNERGEVIEKQKPQFARSQSKIICRIQSRIPIALEKNEVMPQLGRFTIRDEGRTIAVGKVLKYKPAKDTAGIPATSTTTSKTTEETKSDKPTTTNKVKEDVFDMETGKMYTAEEMEKIKKQRAASPLAGIKEDVEDDA